MEERINKLIYSLEKTNYDNEGCHKEYDSILEEFILSYDESLLPLLKKLISIEKDFWYA